MKFLFLRFSGEGVTPSGAVAVGLRGEGGGFLDHLPHVLAVEGFPICFGDLAECPDELSQLAEVDSAQL